MGGKNPIWTSTTFPCLFSTCGYRKQEKGGWKDFMTKNREEQRTDRKHKIVLRKSKIININILNIDWELLLHIQFNSVQFSHSVVSDSLRPYEPQHARPPCPSPTAGVYPNPCPLSQWCHPTISFSVAPISSCPQSFPKSGFFPMSQLFTSDGQSTGASDSTSFLPMNIQDWFPLGLTGLISFQS